MKTKKTKVIAEPPVTVNTFLTNKVVRAIGGPPVNHNSSVGPPKVNNYFQNKPMISNPLNVSPVLPKQRELEPVLYTVNAKDATKLIGKYALARDIEPPTDFISVKSKKSVKPH